MTKGIDGENAADGATKVQYLIQLFVIISMTGSSTRSPLRCSHSQLSVGPSPRTRFSARIVRQQYSLTVPGGIEEH